MEPVRDLYCLWRASRSTIGVGSTPVPIDSFDGWDERAARRPHHPQSDRAERAGLYAVLIIIHSKGQWMQQPPVAQPICAPGVSGRNSGQPLGGEYFFGTTRVAT